MKIKCPKCGDNIEITTEIKWKELDENWWGKINCYSGYCGKNWIATIQPFNGEQLKDMHWECLFNVGQFPWKATRTLDEAKKLAQQLFDEWMKGLEG